MSSATAEEVINRANRRVGNLAAQESLNANEMTDSLQMLNGMMFAFPPRGIQYVHVELAQTDTVNVPDAQVRNVELLLCTELAQAFELPIRPELASDIMRAEQQLQAYYFVSTPAKIGRGLLRWPYGLYSVYRGQ